MGDNIYIEHNDGQVYRLKPRANLEVNRYWITDEVRYGWKFVHDDSRITMPAVRGEDPFEETEAPLAGVPVVQVTVGPGREQAIERAYV